MKKRMLSAFLSLCMVLTMVPAAFAAGDEESATTTNSSDGGTSNQITATTTTLQTGTYTLGSDVTLTSGALTVPNGADVTLNLSGHKLTNKSNEDTIVVALGGKLTIEGTGTVDNVSHAKAAIYNSGTVVLNGGTYDRSAENGSDKETSGQNSYYTILNHGEMTINDGVTVTTAGGGDNLSTKGRFSSLIDNGYYSYTADDPRSGYVENSNAATPSLIINGGIFSGGLNTIKNDDGGKLTIKAGTFENYYQALVQNHNIATIEDGTFSAAADADEETYGVDNCGCAANNDLGTLTISGGTFSGVTYGVWDRSSQPAQVTISGGSFTATQAAVAVNINSNAQIAITGGTFSSDVSDYVATGSKLTQEGENYKVEQIGEAELVVKPETGADGSVSVTLDGKYGGSETNITGGTAAGEGTETDVDANGITVDLSTNDEPASEAETVTLNVPQATAATLSTAPSLTIKSDVGSVTLPKEAMSKIGTATNDVQIGIKQNTSDVSGNVKASYTVEVKAGDVNLLPDSADNNGTIIITVDKPAVTDSTSLQAWYVVNTSGSKIYVNQLTMTNAGDNQLAIQIDHLSTVELLSDDPDTTAVASIASESGTTYYNTLNEAIMAAGNNGVGNIINLLKDASLTSKATISKDITIVGNNHIITGDADDASVNFEVTGGTFNISDVTLKDFGSNVATNSGIAVIKVPDTAQSNTTIKATDVNIDSFCRSAYDIRSGEFTITGGTINSGADTSGENSRLTKGIMAGYGSTQVTGTITNVNITNTNSNYADWDSAGIEVYQNADVTITGGSITNVKNGISVDNYYAGSAGSNTGAAVQVKDVTINATGNAVRVYGSGDGSSVTTTATVSINGGNYTGDIAVVNGGDNTDGLKEIIGVTDATINGDIRNSNGSIGVVNSTVNTDTDEIPQNVTFVDTKVNGENITTEVTSGKVAMVNGVQYDTLQAAVDAAPNGATVALLADVTLDGTDKTNNNGILTISGKNITLDGNGKTITAENVSVTDEDKGPSMINIEGGADVTVRNLTINGEAGDTNTKHGLNVYGSGTSATVENVTIKNGNGYGIVVNGAQATINGLTTSDNGWGGINVDSKSGAASLIVKDADISEENSIKIENSATGDKPDDPTVKIEDGRFQYITKGVGIETPDLTISGGKFATGTYDGAIDVEGYLDPGLSIDSDGNVYKPSGGSGSGGSSGSGGGSTSYTVSVSSGIDNGSVTVSPKNAAKGATVTITVTPDEGYELATLTVKDASGNAIDLTRESDTTYTFEMPSGRVTVDATFAEISTTPSNPFTDVATGAYYADAVLWAVENDITEGTSATTFSPNASCTRAQMVTFLWRAAGSPEPQSAENPFTDVASNAYYADAVLWAVEQGITTGTSETTFSPNATVTRGQTVTFLYRDAGSPAASAAGTFTDVAADAYYAAAVQWAVSEGVTDGMTSTTFQPDGNCTRAQIVTFLYRYLVA